jgi:carboxylesterase type B
MAANHGTVVVSIAYRLGALGFLNSGGGSINGMYGILDQQEAMRWVQKNIGSFGGNPSSVTIFGQSAGAMSVATHLTLPSSEDLFQRAIMESDPFTSPFRTPAEYAKVGTAMGEKAGCSSTSGPALDSCLRGLSVSSIISAQVEVEKDLAVDSPHILEVFLPWTPLVDPSAQGNSSVIALVDQPRTLFSRGQSQDKPFIVGTVANEALLFIYEAFGKPLSHLEYDAFIALVFGLDGALEVGAKYPLPSSQDDDARPWMSHIGTLALFQCSTRNASLGAAASGKNVWLYHFDHVMSFSKAVWGPNFTVCDNYVCHAEELPFVWHPDAQLLDLKYTPAEEVLSNSMQSYWTSFARTGNPNADGTQLNWPAFNPSSEQSIVFQTPQNAILSHNQTTECNWWADVIGFDFE